MDAPHFDLPFRLAGATSIVVVEQDSFEEIANCVTAIVSTPYGYRVDAPDFGFPDLVLQKQPILSDDIIQIVSAQEPRAEILMSEKPDVVDALIDRVKVEIS